MVITSTLIHAAIVVILSTEVKHTVRLTASIGFHLLTYAWNFVKLKLSLALKHELLTAFSPLIKQPDAHRAPPPVGMDVVKRAKHASASSREPKCKGAAACGGGGSKRGARSDEKQRNTKRMGAGPGSRGNHHSTVECPRCGSNVEACPETCPPGGTSQQDRMQFIACAERHVRRGTLTRSTRRSPRPSRDAHPIPARFRSRRPPRGGRDWTRSRRHARLRSRGPVHITISQRSTFPTKHDNIRKSVTHFVPSTLRGRLPQPPEAATRPMQMNKKYRRG